MMCSRWPKCSLGSTVNRNSSTGGSSASVSAWSADGTSRTSRRQAQKEAKMPATTQAVNQNVHAARQDLGRQHRQRMHDEGERQVLVDHLDIEPLAADPAPRDVEDRRDVVVDGREEVAGQPQDGQGEQRHQQQPFDARRDYRGFGRDGWQGGAKIS